MHGCTVGGWMGELIRFLLFYCPVLLNLDVESSTSLFIQAACDTYPLSAQKHTPHLQEEKKVGAHQRSIQRPSKDILLLVLHLTTYYPSRLSTSMMLSIDP